MRAGAPLLRAPPQVLVAFRRLQLAGTWGGPRIAGHAASRDAPVSPIQRVLEAHTLRLRIALCSTAGPAI